MLLHSASLPPPSLHLSFCLVVGMATRPPSAVAVECADCCCRRCRWGTRCRFFSWFSSYYEFYLCVCDGFMNFIDSLWLPSWSLHFDSNRSSLRIRIALLLLLVPGPTLALAHRASRATGLACTTWLRGCVLCVDQEADTTCWNAMTKLANLSCLFVLCLDVFVYVVSC
jgi:hypothetical protein